MSASKYLYTLHYYCSGRTRIKYDWGQCAFQVEVEYWRAFMSFGWRWKTIAMTRTRKEAERIVEEHKRQVAMIKRLRWGY